MSRTATIAATLAVVLLFLGGSGAAACKFALSCGLDRLEGEDSEVVDEQPLAEGEAELPEGWQERTIVKGLDFPTDFAFLPSGDVVVTEKNGLVRAASTRTGRLRRVLDWRSRVSTSDIRGLLTVTVDPAFPSRPYLYLMYIAAVAREGAPTTSNVSRFTWRRGRLDPSSEKRIVVVPEPVAHAGGQIVFAADGTIFVGTGDAAAPEAVPTSLVAQDLDQLRGKVLHVTRDGKGVPENPFWNGDATASRSKVWAYGFRNPFRLTLPPGAETPVVGDVGYLKQDEITAAPRGSNNGWPCYEGTTRGPGGYPDTATCRALYAKGEAAQNPPIVSFDHDEASSLVGGTFLAGAELGAASPRVYVFADYVHGWLRYLDARGGRLVGKPIEFAEGLPGPVALHAGADGALYYLSASTGELRRIERRP